MKYKEKDNIFKDPVCKMVVSRLTAAATCDYEGKKYYFCADICRDKFLSKPERYIGKWPRPTCELAYKEDMRG